MRSQLKNIKSKSKLYLGLPALLMILSGCMRIDQETGEPIGWMSNFIYNFIVTPMSNFLDWLAGNIGSYAIALIILTVLVRLIILPLMLNSQASMIESQAKMKHVKPVTDKIQQLMKETDDPQMQQQLHLQQMKLFKQFNIGLGSQLGGCLPLLIQMPVFVGILHVINNSAEIARETFLGIHLGERSIILAIIVGAVYFVQGKMMTAMNANVGSSSPEQQQTANSMALVNPIMFLFISISSPAGVALYWLVGGLFGILQQFFIGRFYRPRIEEKINAKLRQLPDPEELVDLSQQKVKQSMAETKQVKRQTKQKNRRRNAGKQNRR